MTAKAKTRCYVKGDDTIVKASNLEEACPGLKQVSRFGIFDDSLFECRS
jgi:hypothetical protein